MLPEWKLVSGETLKIRKKKATFAIIFISIFIIIGIVTFSYLRLKSSRESAAVSCIEEDIKKGSVSGKNREKLESYLSERRTRCVILLYKRIFRLPGRRI